MIPFRAISLPRSQCWFGRGRYDLSLFPYRPSQCQTPQYTASSDHKQMTRRYTLHPAKTPPATLINLILTLLSDESCFSPLHDDCVLTRSALDKVLLGAPKSCDLTCAPAAFRPPLLQCACRFGFPDRYLAGQREVYSRPAPPVTNPALLRNALVIQNVPCRRRSLSTPTPRPLFPQTAS